MNNTCVEVDIKTRKQESDGERVSYLHDEGRMPDYSSRRRSYSSYLPERDLLAMCLAIDSDIDRDAFETEVRDDIRSTINQYVICYIRNLMKDQSES